MEVPFFKRRKIFKQTSALDLIPVRLLDHLPREENTIDLLLPRFSHPVLAGWMKSFNQKTIIHIKLDAFGSATWMLIDGKSRVEEISRKLQESFPDKLGSPSETTERVNTFISVLYQQRFITFRQIQKQPDHTGS